MELEAKMSLILRNRDDLLKRIEDTEHEMEKLNAESTRRIAKAEQTVKESVDANREKLLSLSSQVTDLENDVRSHVDRAIRDLETSDLKIQQEMNDLTDKHREHVGAMETFKVWVADELKREFLKINQNFVHSAQIMDAKDKRTQGEIDRVSSDLGASIAQITEFLKTLGNNGGSASAAEIERLERQIKRQADVDVALNTEI